MKKQKSFKKHLALLILAFFALDVFLWQGEALGATTVSDLKDKIDSIESKKKKTEQQLVQTQTLLQKNQYQVSVTKNLINKTENDISRKEKETEALNQRIELNKIILGNYLREMYFSEQDDRLVTLIASDKRVSDLSENFDQLSGVKDGVLETLQDIENAKQELDESKNELAEKKEDHEKLLSIKTSEQYELKTDLKETQATLSELNAKLNKLKGELSSLLGSAVSFKNILDAAGFAAKVTGIRKDYLLGVLVVESNLGRYTGGCTYKQSRMNGTRADYFKAIVKELDLDLNKVKVSCPPSGYKGTGGAMGVAQFMPDTWMGYKSSIAGVTGHNPPNPWNLTDGVVAMALKLTRVDGVKEHKKSAEAKAYCVYLAGNNWAAYCDNKGVNYGAKVLYWADNYEQKLQ